MTTSESNGRFFLQNESIRIDSHNELEWNALTHRQDRSRHSVSSSILIIAEITGQLHTGHARPVSDSVRLQRVCFAGRRRNDEKTPCISILNVRDFLAHIKCLCQLTEHRSKMPLLVGHVDPHLIHDSLGPPECKSNANVSVNGVGL